MMRETIAKGTNLTKDKWRYKALAKMVSRYKKRGTEEANVIKWEKT